MATDFFLDIEGIKGESADDKHKDKIQLLSFSWGASNTGSFASNTGGGAGKATFSDFSFAMNINKASPELMLSCATGKHIKKAQLICRKAGDKQQEYMKVEFTDLLVSSYQTSGAGGSDIPTDSISLNFATLKYEYAPQKADGTLDTPVIRGYDIKKQVKIG
ncbi:MAG TPA: type VI secretion system tube protein Hcp [Opitutaceae bacterium]|nr:type VI secretion system tube protein Hcp [Opitutaceae bacterium]HRE06017.1 type VI secretion system tube protein Hcp [Opitutaceae bacterium]